MTVYEFENSDQPEIHQSNRNCELKKIAKVVAFNVAVISYLVFAVFKHLKDRKKNLN
jgi:hypothetical protein